MALSEADESYLANRLDAVFAQANVAGDRLAQGLRAASVTQRLGAAWQHVGEIVGYRQALGLREADLAPGFVRGFREAMELLHDIGRRLDMQTRSSDG